jgi:hypothetical protein
MRSCAWTTRGLDHYPFNSCRLRQDDAACPQQLQSVRKLVDLPCCQTEKEAGGSEEGSCKGRGRMATGLVLTYRPGRHSKTHEPTSGMANPALRGKRWIASARSDLGCCLLVERCVEASSLPWYMRAKRGMPNERACEKGGGAAGAKRKTTFDDAANVRGSPLVGCSPRTDIEVEHRHGSWRSSEHINGHVI